MAKKNLKRKNIFFQPFTLIIFTLLVIYVISFLTPLFWSFFTSFKNKQDFILNKLGLPKKWYFSNYKTVFDELYIISIKAEGVIKIYTWRLILNALFYTVCSTLVSIFTRCLAAYAAARYSKYFVIRMLYPIVIITMLLPIIGSLPAELQMLRAIGAYDNVLGMIMLKGGFLGTNFLILYATFKGISWEYAEAAFVDGASHFIVLFKIMIPLASASLTALMLLSFIGFWNDWGVNVIYLPNFPMISYALFMFQTNTVTSISTVPHKLAASMLVSFPMLVMFITFKNKLMGNLSMGGIKG